MKLFYIRHVESIANANGIVAGHSDVPISKLGTTQLKELYKILGQEKVSAIYSSDLSRTRLTAEFIKKKCPDAPLVLTSQLRGRNYSGIEGKAVPTEQKESFYQSLYKIDFDYPGVESLKDFYERNFKFLLGLLQKHQNDNIIIVAHASNGRMISAIANGIGIERIGSDVRMPLPSEMRTFNLKNLAYSSN
ncbi:MAG: histidine phosphatase family protein [Candidatus Micrarchaeota archaeon]|nr:histidine phosphatase family protein [Candidatus Micrarchaeota archaeon]